MAHPTFPSVYYDDVNNEYVCLMKDKRTGKVWGTGYGSSRNEAIASARYNQPSDSVIKKAIGWVVTHPVVTGTVWGAALAFRDARQNGYHDWKRYTKLALIGAGIGLAVWAAGKILKGVFGSRSRG